MAKDILRIKISLPPLASNMLTRSQILDQLEASSATGRCVVTLIATPAGYGKTTLARMYLTHREDSSSWYSLDTRDNQRTRFWIYLIAALQTHNPTIGQGTEEILRTSGLGSDIGGSSESILTPLLNDLFCLQTPQYLVIDDYHLITDRQIHEDMVFFIENSPPMLKLVVTTRSEPPWPVARWRARGALAEARQRDLLFSQEEVVRLFTDIKGMQLAQSDLDTLYTKTEGVDNRAAISRFFARPQRRYGEISECFCR